MPSLNHDIPLSTARRIRINTCEGEVALIYQARDDFGKWETMATITMTADQAMRLHTQLRSTLAHLE